MLENCLKMVFLFAVNVTKHILGNKLHMSIEENKFNANDWNPTQCLYNIHNLIILIFSFYIK